MFEGEFYLYIPPGYKLANICGRDNLFVWDDGIVVYVKQILRLNLAWVVKQFYFDNTLEVTAISLPKINVIISLRTLDLKDNQFLSVFRILFNTFK